MPGASVGRACAVMMVVSVLGVAGAVAPRGAEGVSPRTAAGADLLPDLDQEVPTQLDVSVDGAPRGRPSYRLGFGSGVRNVGAGPLVIDGRRAAGARGMVARQLIAQSSGGAPRAVTAAGSLRYVRSPDHQHWHLLRFDRYELRLAGANGRVLVRDRKTGFCLGDRYRVTTRKVPGAVARAAYRTRCGLRRPGLRHVREGISVGYGDFYAAHLEYQDLPIDGLPDGRYVLVHRANVDRRLLESNYDNNAASVLLSLKWQHGVPRLAVLAACPDSARCDRPAAGVVAAKRLRPAPARRLVCALMGTGDLPTREPSPFTIGA